MKHLERQLCAAVRASLEGAEGARPPEAGTLLWNAFQRLSARRSYHMAGPNPISFSEVEAYCRLMRLPLEPRHVSVIMAMDQAWLDHAHSRAKPPEGLKASPHISQRQISAALFDAMTG